MLVRLIRDGRPDCSDLFFEPVTIIVQGFTHGGRPLSLAAEMADQARRRYVRHSEDGREVLTPGLRWFAKLVQSVLVEFLRRQGDEAQTSLGKLVIQENVLMLRARRPIEAGRVVTFEDIDLG